MSESESASDEVQARDVDGLDQEELIPPGDYPIDSLMIRTDRRTVFEVCRRIEQEVYILDPEFQRDFIWDERKQSRLIESAMMRIPLPVFYLAETQDGKIVVVDGLQRLSTFRRFLKDELRLKRLTYADKMNGRRFSDLPPNLAHRVEDTSLTLYLIDSRAPDQAKLDIFERVNSGEPLTTQQMRNCLYLGAATRWLARMAKTREFLEATAGGLSSRTMRDRECINRFLAFSDAGLGTYTGNMDNFLRDVLVKHRNANDEFWAAQTAAFLESMRINRDIFGANAFRKVKSGEKTGRSVINVALFDVFSVLFAAPKARALLPRAQALRDGLNRLLENSEFFDSITMSTNSVRKVVSRFELVSALIKEVQSET